MAFWNRPQESKRPSGDELARLLSISWPEFEGWIRHAIGGTFVWKARPRDTPNHRQMVIDSIYDAIERNDGTFPKHDAFLEREQ